jgi:hypothetical protein
MARRGHAAIAVLAIAAAAFGAGFVAHDVNAAKGLNPPTLTASCITGAVDGSCEADGTSYGLEPSVPWTDSGGVFHEGGWPDCLARLSQIDHVRIQGDWITLGGTRAARVLWVDCHSG